MLFPLHLKSRWWLGIACAVAVTGCSQSRMTVNHAPSTGPMPNRTSVSVPGTADGPQGGDVRHPETVHLAYGRWQEQQKQFPQARESYQRALQYEPRSAEALLGLSRMDRLAGRTSQAEEHLKRADKLRPNDPLVAAGWGEHYAAMGNMSQAVAKYREAISLAPQEAVYKHQLAIALTNAGDLDGGYDVFASIVSPAEAHYNIGYLLQQQGKTSEAEQEFQQALALNPNLTPATTMLTKLQQQRGRSEPWANQPRQAPIVPASNQGGADTSGAVPAVWQSDVSDTSKAPSHVAEPPPGLTPQQLEQWKNQQVLQH